MPDVELNRAILIADADSFESGYVAAALTSAGATVIGPLQTRDEIHALLETGTPKAVIIGKLADASCWDLTEMLRTRGIAHLLLIDCRHDDREAGSDISVLRKPFGAYQVVDWATKLAPPSLPMWDRSDNEG